ncbi:6,7-dimethyl-8-ribityllumazine synthase, partial [Flavobacterium sp. HMWF030]
TEAAIAAIKMAYIRQQASISHSFNQPLLSSGAIQIEETPITIEKE